MRATRRTFVSAALAFVGGMLLLWTVRHLASTRFIDIVEAEYGVPGRTCTAGPDIKKYVSAACAGFRPRCLVSVSNSWCGDPAAGVVKTLTVFLSLALYVRAILAVRRGNADQAIAVVRESLTHIRELHDTFAFVYALVPLAAAAVLKGDDEWAARILGTRDAVTERTGVTVVDEFVRDLRDQAEREVRARLGPDRWSQAYEAGRMTTIDSSIKEIDSVLRTRARE
jgi:hypothetical protein